MAAELERELGAESAPFVGRPIPEPIIGGLLPRSIASAWVFVLRPRTRNPAHVLGVGAQVESVNGPVFAAYFAASRERFDTQPNYKSGLFVLVDGAVYSVRQESVTTSIKRGFTTREFTLLRGDRPQRSVEYRWPWYREPFLSADPGLARSQDFLREMSTMVRAYG